MTTSVSFKARNGGDASGLLTEPSGADASTKAPALVLIQEWWGINEHLRSIATRLAAEGFLVVTPDLYHGTIAKNADEAGKLMTELDTLQAVQEIAGAVAFAKEHARSNGKVGVIGFCMGGALAFASACHVEGLSAVVPFYGIPPADKVDYAKVTAPVLAHFAKNDDWATVEKAEGIKKQLDALGKPMQLEVYDAGHAFVNDSRPEAYDEKSAKLAWRRSVEFLKKHLA
jgi:carboxymethylenebutenolidase